MTSGDAGRSTGRADLSETMESDAAIFAAIRTRLFSAVIGDVLDLAGYRQQFLPPRLRPLDPEMMIVGRAMTVKEADMTVDDGDDAAFGLMFTALDDLKADEIYLCSGSRGDYALWGELMSRRARHLGAAGAILDGFHRDTRGIRALGFPVFSAGAYAQDQRPRGRVTDYRCRLVFDNGTVVENGDVLVGDCDGVVVIPAAILQPTIAAALEKAGAEDEVGDLIDSGETTAAIFARMGVM